MDPKNWQQFLFDLMCNKNITLEISGEMGQVDANLCINEWKNGRKTCEIVAEVIEVSDFETAMNELVKQVVAAS